MKNIKNLGIALIISTIFLLVLTLFMTIFSYIGWFKSSFVEINKIIIPIISLFIGGVYLGRKANKKGWLEGIKLGISISILIILFNYLALNYQFEIYYLIYIAIILISSIFGSMIGINISKEKND